MERTRVWHTKEHARGERVAGLKCTYVVLQDGELREEGTEKEGIRQEDVAEFSEFKVFSIGAPPAPKVRPQRRFAVPPPPPPPDLAPAAGAVPPSSVGVSTPTGPAAGASDVVKPKKPRDPSKPKKLKSRPTAE